MRCGHCAHTARLEAHSLTEKLGQALSIRVLPELFASLRCTQCAQRKIRIYDEKGQVLLDYAQITPCRRCGLPIPIPRLAVLPGCRLCLSCAMEESRPVLCRLTHECL